MILFYHKTNWNEQKLQKFTCNVQLCTISMFCMFILVYDVTYVEMQFNPSWRRPLLYRNQSIDLLYKSIDWFLYGNGLHHERVKSSVRKKLFRRKRNLSIMKSQPSAHIPLPIRKFLNSSSLELYKLNNWLWKNQWI